jgi:hypothetical protein
LDNDVLYTLEQMDEIFDGLQLKSIIMKGGNEYQIKLSDTIKKDLGSGMVALNSLECSLLNISDSVFRKIGNDDVLYDCKETNMRLVLSKRDNTLEVLVARPIEIFPIY